MPTKPEILKRETVMRSRLFRADQIHLRFSNGEERHYEKLVGGGNGAVLIVPVLNDDTFLLVKEYAVGLEDYHLACPKGAIDEGDGVFAERRHHQGVPGGGERHARRLCAHRHELGRAARKLHLRHLAQPAQCHPCRQPISGDRDRRRARARGEADAAIGSSQHVEKVCVGHDRHQLLRSRHGRKRARAQRPARKQRAPLGKELADDLGIDGPKSRVGASAHRHATTRGCSARKTAAAPARAASPSAPGEHEEGTPIGPRVRSSQFSATRRRISAEASVPSAK